MNFKLPSEDCYTIYTKSMCTNCLHAKNLLGLETIEIVDCDEYLKRHRTEFLALMSYLADTQIKCFPIIFCCGKYIGSYNELKRHDIFLN